jgi:hypothetical protein
MFRGILVNKTKGGMKVYKTIDVHDLSEEEIELLRKFIEFLREKAKARGKVTVEKEEIIFAHWPLGVKGKLTRREIYDYP